jgi:protein-L-isoaspartate O-methyltransferase
LPAARPSCGLNEKANTNIEVRVANGYFGWHEHAPFDKVAPDLIPPPLINQLKSGGRMVLPVGLPDAQQLLVIDKDMNGSQDERNYSGIVVIAGGNRPAWARVLKPTCRSSSLNMEHRRVQVAPAPRHGAGAREQHVSSWRVGSGTRGKQNRKIWPMFTSRTKRPSGPGQSQHSQQGVTLRGLPTG